MDKLQKVVMALLTLSMCWSQSAQSQDDATRAVPVEFFACNWVEGKGMKDLDKVSAAFADWSRANDSSYSAWVLTPQFHDSPDMFDVGWLGAWTDAKAFGRGQDAWQSGGGELAADFARVMDCSGLHQMASSVAISAPDDPPGDGVVMFSQCSVKEGKNLTDSYEAHKELATGMKANGSKASSYVFYPSLGTSNADFDYWSVLSFQNYTDLGAGMEMYLNGGGYQKAVETLGPVVSCKSPSVFDARRVVAAGS